MVAGLNLKVTVHRLSQSTDDASGGAMFTGTVQYQDIAARLAARMPSQQALEQGLEVDRLIDMSIVGRGLTVNERDEVEVTWPIDHPYFGERFRVVGLQVDGRRPAHGHREFTLSRIERGRGQQ
jgi:hypothetical protein